MRALDRLWRALRRKEARRGAVVAVVAVVLAFAALSPDDDQVEATGDTTSTSERTTTTERATNSTTEPTTTTARPTTTTAAPAREAADLAALLAAVPVGPEGVGAPYERSRFGGGWIDADGDGCDTRAEVLIAESTTLAQVDPYGCHVVTGDWLSSYDGYSTDDPTQLEVDHVVALAEAWRSGADGWSDERRSAFANDLGHPGALVAVTAATNQSKSDRDPASWQPPHRAAWCRFAVDWLEVKARWGLRADQAEHDALRNMLRGCDGTTSPVTIAPAPAAAPPTTAAAPAPAAPLASGGGACDPSYPGVCILPPPPDLDCGDIGHRRFQVLPPDPHRFDGEGDGVGCES